MQQRERVHAEERPVSELIPEFIQETRKLIQEEIALARREMSLKGSAAARALASTAIGAAILYGGYLALLAAGIFALDLVLPLWASALIIAGVAIIVGAILAMTGYGRLKSMDWAPRRTIQTLKEDQQWAKSEVTQKGDGRS